MNDLETYFYNNPGRLIHKWTHYFEAYDRHFQRFRNKKVVILEIGVYQGGSLQMWKHYFGPQAEIYGIDLNPMCKQYEEENITILTGSQSDRQFLQKVRATIPPVDILIDDGGHTMRQQIITFEELFGHVKPDGVYLCEDIQTSYQITYGGGYKRKGTFIEYSKNFIDLLHAYHSTQSGLTVTDFTRSVKSLHYYDSILVIEKGQHNTPEHVKTGTASHEDTPTKKVPAWKTNVVMALNKILRAMNLPNYKWK